MSSYSMNKIVYLCDYIHRIGFDSIWQNQVNITDNETQLNKIRLFKATCISKLLYGYET